jgi:hypothetical protein
MFYTKHRPEDIKKLVSKDDFRKSQKYSKAKMQFGMVHEYYDYIYTVVIWYSGLPPMCWEYTKPWTEKNVGADGSLHYDFVQAMFLVFFLMLVNAILETPSALFS